MIRVPPRKARRKRKRISWRRVLEGAARAIRSDAAQPIIRPEAQRMARYFIAALVPRRRPGRKPTPEVAKAVALRLGGEPWRGVYPAVFEDYARMPSYERSWKCHRLRRAVAASLKRRRKIQVNE